MTRSSGLCQTCGTSECHQKRCKNDIIDNSYDLVDDALLSNMNPVDAFICQQCGFVGCVVEYQQDGDGYWDLDTPCDCEPRFCPNCGAKVAYND